MSSCDCLDFLGGALAGAVITAPFAVPLSAQESDARTTYEYLDLFGDIFERVRASYVEKADEKALIESAINGMLASLDPHSSYLPPSAFDDMKVQTKGEFGGLGIEVTMEDGFVKVVTPMDDTPASRAGLESGDLLTAINGQPIVGLNIDDAVRDMRGPPGSEIIVTVLREGEEKRIFCEGAYQASTGVVRPSAVAVAAAASPCAVAHQRLRVHRPQTVRVGGVRQVAGLPPHENSEP